jgi:Flp pilus assembly protein TadG
MTAKHKCGAVERKIPIGVTAKRRESGSGLVEQALVLTVLLMVMFGIIDFGRALYTYHFVSNAARDATRWASVRGSKCQPPVTFCGADPGDVHGFVSDVAGMGLDTTKITTITAWAAPPSGCPAPANSPGCVVQVTVNYTYDFLPLFGLPGITMSSTSQMVITQ